MLFQREEWATRVFLRLFWVFGSGEQFGEVVVHTRDPEVGFALERLAQVMDSMRVVI